MNPKLLTALLVLIAAGIGVASAFVKDPVLSHSLIGAAGLIIGWVLPQPQQSPLQSAQSNQRGFAEVKAMVGAMVFACLMAFVVVFAIVESGCKAVCPIISAADTACPYVVVALTDGGTEVLEKREVVQAAEKQRAARAAKDGGQ